jgi:GNAT superfamily N-acetyltransferase
VRSGSFGRESLHDKEFPMLKIEQIDSNKRSDVIRFYKVPFPMYAGSKQWVPPLWSDLSMQLNRKKHPFYEHSDADFFIAVRDGQDVGRIAVMENKPYNRYHKRKIAAFYLFETVEDPEVAAALFEQAFDWARKRGLDSVMGPKGFGPLDGYGMLVEGFDRRQTMMMSAYNPPYYPQYMETLGFRKEVDFITCLITRDHFRMPERVHRIAGRVLKRGTFRVLSFKNKKDLLRWVPGFIKAYNAAFVANWEYYPLSEWEINFVVDNIMEFLDQDLIKIITHKDEVVGFVLSFPDISAALQRTRGYVPPLSLLDSIPPPLAIVDILREVGRTEWLALNGGGILPEFKGVGGNALMYSEMEKTLNSRFRQFKYGELCQVAETAKEMRSDLANIGGAFHKNHRVFIRQI